MTGPLSLDDAKGKPMVGVASPAMTICRQREDGHTSISSDAQTGQVKGRVSLSLYVATANKTRVLT